MFRDRRDIDDHYNDQVEHIIWNSMQLYRLKYIYHIRDCPLLHIYSVFLQEPDYYWIIYNE